MNSLMRVHMRLEKSVKLTLVTSGNLGPTAAHFDGQSEGKVGRAFFVTTARMTSLSLSCLNTYGQGENSLR